MILTTVKSSIHLCQTHLFLTNLEVTLGIVLIKEIRICTIVSLKPQMPCWIVNDILKMYNMYILCNQVPGDIIYTYYTFLGQSQGYSFVIVVVVVVV